MLRPVIAALVLAWIAVRAPTARAQITAPQPPSPPVATALVGRVADPPWLGLLRPRQGVFGVQIVEVYEDSGAAAAGLVPGDEILFIDDSSVTSVNDLVMEVMRHAVGDQVEVRLVRGGAELLVPVQLGARVDDREMLHRRLVGKPAPSAVLRRLDDDRQQDPSALRGKVVVLAWFSTRCDACGDIISELSELAASHRDVVVTAVTAAEPPLLATYLTRSAIGVPVAVVDDEDFAQYGLLGGRADSSVAFVVIDRSGMVRMAAAVGGRAEPGEATATVEDVIAGARQLLRAPRR